MDWLACGSWQGGHDDRYGAEAPSGHGAVLRPGRL